MGLDELGPARTIVLVAAMVAASRVPVLAVDPWLELAGIAGDLAVLADLALRPIRSDGDREPVATLKPLAVNAPGLQPVCCRGVLVEVL